MNRKKYEHRILEDCVSDLELLNSIDYLSEVEYFKKVINYLIDTINSIESRCEDLRGDAQPFTYSPTMEERIELGETRRRLINLSNSIIPLEESMLNPYFCKIKINSNKKGINEIYVGENDIIDNGNILVHSWASSVGRQYYENSNPKITIWGQEFNKELVRNIVIINSKISKIYESFINDLSNCDNIYDPYLQEILSRKKNVEGITNIISTIQKNQFAVISKDIKENFIVQGCAGSGKTMIMLHRLSYLFYNVVNLSLDADKIKIISPSKVFTEQITDLSESINISNVARYCLEDYYLDKIYNYNSKVYSAIYSNNSKNNETKILYNYLNTDLYAYIYSKEFEDIIIRFFNQYIDNLYLYFSNEKLSLACDYYGVDHFDSTKKSLPNLEIKIRKIKTKNDEILHKQKKKKDKIELALYSLNPIIKKIDLDIKKIDDELNILESISHVSSKIEENQLILNNLKAKYNNNNEIISTLNEILTLQNKIKSTTSISLFRKNSYLKKLENLEKKLNEAAPKLIKNLDYSNLLNELLSEKSNIEIKMKQCEKEHKDCTSSMQEIIKNGSVDIDIDFDLNSYTECCNKINEKNFKLTDLKKQLNNSISKKEKYIVELKNVFIVGKNNLDTVELSQKLDHLIKKLDEYDIIFNELYPLIRKELFNKFTLENTERVYKFDLYIILYLCYLLKGPIIKKDKYIFIDEGQDISTYDYNLINIVNDKKIIFNIFGDVNQCIYPSHGIVDWDQLSFLNNFKLYSLNENYRNNINIVEYCIKEVGYKMLPIGLEMGNLTIFEDVDKAISQIITDKCKRKAIITRYVDDYLIEKLKKSPMSNKLNYITSTNQSIDSSKLNIIPVNLVKGLEFDASLILVKGMTRNEKYIALTRSLVNEYILIN